MSNSTLHSFWAMWLEASENMETGLKTLKNSSGSKIRSDEFNVTLDSQSKLSLSK